MEELEEPMSVDHSQQSNPNMEQTPTYPVGRSVLMTHRDKYREWFDVPDHPLWDDLNIPRMPPFSTTTTYPTRKKVVKHPSITND